jgi:hypothetical protein
MRVGVRDSSGSPDDGTLHPANKCPQIRENRRELCLLDRSLLIADPTMKLLEVHGSKPTGVEAGRVRLVVVEEGAGGFESRVPPDAREETIVVAQTSGELPANLVTRVASRIASIERSGRTIGQAIVLLDNRHDAQVGASRWSMARALLSHLLVSGGSELVLDADGAEVNVRHELLSIVEALLEEFEQGRVPIRLQFRREPPRAVRPSGIYAVPETVQSAPRMTGSERA